MSDDDTITTRITVPISRATERRIQAVADAHPITTKATIARFALEQGLNAVEKIYPPKKAVNKGD